MFFGKIILYTCDICMELNFLNIINISNYPNVLKKSLFPCNLLLENFKTLKFSYDLGFHQIHLKICFFIKGNLCFLYKKIWKKLHYILSIFFNFLKGVIWTLGCKHSIITTPIFVGYRFFSIIFLLSFLNI
jgi:hypothetical protein